MNRPAETALLRLMPSAASDDVITPAEVAERLGLSQAATYQRLVRAVRCGLIVRVRPGAYRLAGGAR